MRISLLLIVTILSSNSNAFTDPLPTKAQPDELKNLQNKPICTFLLINNPESFINDSIQGTSREQFAETIKNIKKYTENDVLFDDLENALNKKIEKIEQIHKYGIDVGMLISGGKWLAAAAASYLLIPPCENCTKNPPRCGCKLVPTIPTACWGIRKIYNGLTPPDEYKNLEKAKDFLKIVQGFQTPQK
jgi:hypothetical protein